MARYVVRQYRSNLATGPELDLPRWICLRRDAGSRSFSHCPTPGLGSLLTHLRPRLWLDAGPALQRRLCAYLCRESFNQRAVANRRSTGRTLFEPRRYCIAFRNPAVLKCDGVSGSVTNGSSGRYGATPAAEG